jgi:hypothetical protein
LHRPQFVVPRTCRSVRTTCFLAERCDPCSQTTCLLTPCSSAGAAFKRALSAVRRCLSSVRRCSAALRLGCSGYGRAHHAGACSAGERSEARGAVSPIIWIPAFCFASSGLRLLRSMRTTDIGRLCLQPSIIGKSNMARVEHVEQIDQGMLKVRQAFGGLIEVLG